MALGQGDLDLLARRARHHKTDQPFAWLIELGGDGAQRRGGLQPHHHALARAGRRLVEIDDAGGAQFQFVAVPVRRGGDQQRLAGFQQGPRGRQHFGKQHHFKHAGGIGEGDKGIHLVVAAAPFGFLDQGAGQLGLEAGAAIFCQAGIGCGSQPLERRAIGVQRMAGEIKSHGAEFFAQPLMHRPVGNLRQAQFLLRRPRRTDCAGRFRAPAPPPGRRPGCGRNFPPPGGGSC